MFVVKKNSKNPIISPRKDYAPEGYATFNGSPIQIGKDIHILYRAQSLPERVGNDVFSLSSICRATSKDGINFSKREQFIVPEEKWERYGCEDPRVTKIGSKYYIFYTALSIYPFSAPGIRVGLAISSDLKKVSEKHLITPFNAKAMTLFPEKINGKYVAMLTVNPDVLPTHIALAEFKNIEDMWDQKFWEKWYSELDKHILFRGDHKDRIEIGSTPIKTKKGWLIVCCRIQNHADPNRVFSVEAFLLDLKNPKKIIGKTRSPLIVPEEQYEIYGIIPRTIFPSGAIIKGKDLYIYYGSTDTTIALATVPLDPLLESMKLPHGEFGFKRLTKGPLLVPRKDFEWESRAVFNPACLDIDGTISILYRAMSEDNTSVMGIAETKNATKITYRGDKPVYVPRESFEEKRVPGGNSGCEDPRLTMIGDIIYVYYTAYNGITPPAVAMSKISKKDFIKKNWDNWSKPVLVTADGVDDKDGCLHPELVKGKYMLFHRVNGYVCIDFGKTPAFTERNSFKNIPVLLPRRGMWDSKKVGIAAPPIKTKKGWLLLYHGVSEDSVYRVGAALLDLKDPSKVLSRTTDYIFAPIDLHDKEGQVNNVVFPCGNVLRKGKIYIYYGGGDSALDVAEIKLENLLKVLS